ncbi:26S proteasome regulatory subunit 4 homolog B-like [Hibiscus syriacus]|uniref:26S proteasome regulatory subunit 4 homolog B-like n=1 Tax=Hibiscus syriacus TaxID=106335 RepID=UPI00192082D7|nr:26S proteasome regulatory subunit 4 homolog B-like [Hibiscus syriacus]
MDTHYLQLATASALLSVPRLQQLSRFILARAEVFYLRLSLFAISVYLFHESLFKLAVANSTSAIFLRVVGSELIQKYLGDGPKLVRELFRVADDISPSIVFIDEIDAVCTKR